MKVLVFSDLHFFRDRLSYLIPTCNWLSQRILDTNPDAVVFCGDLNHSHTYVDTDTLDIMVRCMKGIHGSCQQVGAPFLMVSGNHDQASKDAKENILTVFDAFSDICCALTLPRAVKVGELNALLAPYPPATKVGGSAYWDVFREQVKTADVIFSHWEISGIPYHPTAKAKNTDHAVDLGPLWKGAIVNGHYHHPDTYDMHGSRVYVVGAPCFYNYADTWTTIPRGYLELEFRSNSHRGMFIETANRVGNPHGPIYHTVTTDSYDKATFFDGLDPLSEYADRLKLRIKLRSAEDYETNKSLINLLQNRFPSARLVGDLKARTAARVEVVATLEAGEVLDQYLSSTATPLDLERLRTLGLQLLQECAS